MTKPSTLSASARTVLTTAAQRPDRVALPPERLPAAARRAVVQSLLKAGLLEEITADDDQPTWRTADRARFALRATDAGLRAIGMGLEDGGRATTAETAQSAPPTADTACEAPHAPAPSNAAQEAPCAPQRADTRQTLRTAAQAVIEAWEDATESRPALPVMAGCLSELLSTAHRPERSRVADQLTSEGSCCNRMANSVTRRSA